MIERYENKSKKFIPFSLFRTSKMLNHRSYRVQENVQGHILYRFHFFSISFRFSSSSWLVVRAIQTTIVCIATIFFPDFCVCNIYIYKHGQSDNLLDREIETLWTIVRVIVISCKFDRENSFLRFETQLSRGSMAGSLFFFNYHGYRIIYSELHILFQPSNDT